MKFVERAVIALLFVAMLVAIHQIIGSVVTAHDWKGLAPSDWAAWVQAIGSIAAIWGAVWIFKSDTSMRRAEAQVIGDLAAARHFPRLEHLLDQVEGINRRLDNFEVMDVGHGELFKIAYELRQMAGWNLDELPVLATLPNQCALHLSYGLGQLTAVALFMRDEVDSGELPSDVERRFRCAAESSAILGNASHHLHAAALVMLPRIPR